MTVILNKLEITSDIAARSDTFVFLKTPTGSQTASRQEINPWKSSGELERTLYNSEDDCRIYSNFSCNSRMLGFNSTGVKGILGICYIFPGPSHPGLWILDTFSDISTCISLAFSRDDMKVAIASLDCVRVYNIGTGGCRLDKDVVSARSVTIDAFIRVIVMLENDWLVATCFDGDVKPWNTITGECIKSFPLGHLNTSV